MSAQATVGGLSHRLATRSRESGAALLTAWTGIPDALLAGVPVVTLTGNSFASRVATSLLHDAGHPEWACADLASYRACALELAASRGQRKTVADVQWPISQQMQASAFGELLASI